MDVCGLFPGHVNIAPNYLFQGQYVTKTTSHRT